MATIYGLGANALLLNEPHPSTLNNTTIAWVDWLELPAVLFPDRAVPAETLARQGHEEAIAFLLTRLLNPQFCRSQASGQIFVRAVIQGPLLHVVLDAPICPPRRWVGPLVGSYVEQLQLCQIAGVRVHGHRLGQNQSQWSYTLDFTPRSHRVKKGDARGAELSPTVHGHWPQGQSDLLLSTIRRTQIRFPLTRITQKLSQLIRQLLLWSQCFVPNPERAEKTNPRGLQIALVWGAAGLLLTLQLDWGLGQVLHHSRAAVSSSALGPTLADTVENSESAGAMIPSSQFSTSFNHPLLEAKWTLFRQYVRRYGSPEVLVIGSSRALRGVDPDTLQQGLAARGHQSIGVFNFGINGATAQVVDLIIRRLLSLSQLPKIIVWADGVRAFNSGRLDVTHNAIIASEGYRQLSSGPLISVHGTESLSLQQNFQRIDQELNETLGSLSFSHTQRDRLKALLVQGFQTRLRWLWPGIDPPHFRSKIDQETVSVTQLDARGFLPLSKRFNPVAYYQQYTYVSGQHDSDYRSFQLAGQQNEAFQQLLQFIQQQQLTLVFVNLPLTRTYLDPPRRQYEVQFRQYMLNQAQRENLIFIDWGQLWLDQHDYFSDPSHLNRRGAQAISQRLAQDLAIPWSKLLQN